jgi:glycosyltransferase involved in cell wall biosynthesis
MIEAMACGTPVIATPRGSVPEVIADGETGFIVSVENYAEEATDRLSRLDEISPVACRDRVDRLFDKDAMVEGYARIYEEVVDSA